MADEKKMSLWSHRRRSFLSFLTILVFAYASASSVAYGQSNRTLARREVAVTFDDLPGVAMLQGQRCNRKAYEEINAKLLRTITSHKIPALGLVVGGRLCGRETDVLPILEMWLNAGLELGNHSFSHFDLNTTPLDRYQADVIRGETLVKRLLQQRGKRLKYFRHPFLHAGKDAKTKTAFEKFLANRGYTVAPVTIDNQEWVFAEVYARAKSMGDVATARRVGDAYIRYMDDIFDFFEKRSVEVVGYEIRQTLLLHVSPLNADYFDRLTGMMKRRGYTFVSMDHALSDRAYRSLDTYTGPRGLSWLHRWALSKGMKMREEPPEPEFIAELYRSYFGRSASTYGAPFLVGAGL